MDPFTLANPGVRRLRPYEPGKPIEELQREYGVRDIIKLASNENPLGPSPSVAQVIRDQIKNLSRYPDGNGFALKTLLANRLALEPKQVTLGNGSNDVLELIARAFVNTGEEVMFSQHAFAVYPIVTQAVGGNAIVVPAKNWGHDLDAMAQSVTERTRVIFVANPNNPTGTWIQRQALEVFLNTIPENIIVVVDEAYYEYVQEPDYPDSTKWLSRFPNLVVTRTFSKVYGLAGLRLGYGLSSPGVADILNRVRQPFNVNSLALAAGEAALQDDAYVKKSVKLNCEGMEQLAGAFQEMGLPYIPSAGNFIAVDTGQPAGKFYEALLRLGVIVRPVANYEMPNHLRITIGLPEENRRFIDSFKQVLKRA